MSSPSVPALNYDFLPQDGEMIPYTKELGDTMKHSLRKVGRKYIFTMRDLRPEDGGFYQLDVENVNIFSTDFKSKPTQHLVRILNVHRPRASILKS